MYVENLEMVILCAIVSAIVSMIVSRVEGQNTFSTIDKYVSGMVEECRKCMEEIAQSVSKKDEHKEE